MKTDVAPPSASLRRAGALRCMAFTRIAAGPLKGRKGPQCKRSALDEELFCATHLEVKP